jgi:hypothetical protein
MINAVINAVSAAKEKATICMFGGFGWLPKQTDLALKKFKLNTKVLERIQMGDIEYILLSILPAKIPKALKTSKVTGEYALIGKQRVMQDLEMQKEKYLEHFTKVQKILKPWMKAYIFM